MGLKDTAYFNRIEYRLRHKDFPDQIITEPKGYKSDYTGIARHNKYDGMFPVHSNNMEFVGDGAIFINTLLNLYGVGVEIQLIKKERHPFTNRWTTLYYSSLDIPSRKHKGSDISIKIKSGGLETLIKDNVSTKVELDRLTTLSGSVLPTLPTQTIKSIPRRIFLHTEYDVKPDSNSTSLYFESESGLSATLTTALPLNLKTKSHDKAVSVFPNSNGELEQGSGQQMFFVVNDRDRLLDIKLNITSSVSITQEDVIWAYGGISLTTYKNGYDFNFKERRDLVNWNTKEELFSAHNQTYNLQLNQQFWLYQGESLDLEAWLNFNLGGPGGEHIGITCHSISGSLIIDEDSNFESTNMKCVLAHDMGDRLTEITTGKKNAFYSEALGRTDLGYNEDGEFALDAYTHGHYLRELEQETDLEKRKFKPLTTSLKDWLEHNYAVNNLTIGIEKIGKRERIRMEKRSFFFNNNTLIKLPYEVSNLERKQANEFIYDEIIVGYEKGWKNEESQGLDEPNGQTTFKTYFTGAKKTLRLVSKYIAGSYPKEFTRRRHFSLFPTLDHTYDNDIFALTLKRFGDLFQERVYSDDLEELPTGVFSPETLTNASLFPIQNLFRHKWLIATTFIKNTYEYLIYTSSEGNSEMGTKPNGQQYRKGNENIQGSDFGKARFYYEWVTFEHVCDFGVMEQIYGQTEINGKMIPNFYGLIEFKHKGKKEKGFLFKLNPENKGKWKVLIANRK